MADITDIYVHFIQVVCYTVTNLIDLHYKPSELHLTFFKFQSKIEVFSYSSLGL